MEKCSAMPGSGFENNSYPSDNNMLAFANACMLFL